MSRTVSRPPRAAKPRPPSGPDKKKPPKKTIAGKKRKRMDKATRGLPLRPARSLRAFRDAAQLTQDLMRQAPAILTRKATARAAEPPPDRECPEESER